MVSDGPSTRLQTPPLTADAAMAGRCGEERFYSMHQVIAQGVVLVATRSELVHF